MLLARWKRETSEICGTTSICWQQIKFSLENAGDNKRHSAEVPIGLDETNCKPFEDANTCNCVVICIDFSVLDRGKRYHVVYFSVLNRGNM
jgi:hypothetical protein